MRRLRGDQIEVFNILNGYENILNGYENILNGYENILNGYENIDSNIFFKLRKLK